MIKKSKRNNYSIEFKQEAVELASRVGIAKASLELEVHQTSIRSWRKKLQGPDTDSSNEIPAKTYGELEKENKRLQKELGYMKEINKVLKKSTAILSMDQLGNIK